MASNSCQWPVERLNPKWVVEIVDVGAFSTLQAKFNALLLELSNKFDATPI